MYLWTMLVAECRQRRHQMAEFRLSACVHWSSKVASYHHLVCEPIGERHCFLIDRLHNKLFCPWSGQIWACYVQYTHRFIFCGSRIASTTRLNATSIWPLSFHPTVVIERNSCDLVVVLPMSMIISNASLKAASNEIIAHLANMDIVDAHTMILVHACTMIHSTCMHYDQSTCMHYDQSTRM